MGEIQQGKSLICCFLFGTFPKKLGESQLGITKQNLVFLQYRNTFLHTLGFFFEVLALAIYHKNALSKQS